MKFKYNVALALGGLLFLASCKDERKSSESLITTSEGVVNLDSNLLIGSWEDESKQALDFSLFADGMAQSDAANTLLFHSWYLADDVLFVVTESFGNKQSIVDTIAYDVLELISDELKLKKGNLILNFNKVMTKSRAVAEDQRIQTIQGDLTYGHESRTIKLDGSDTMYWVQDSTGQLADLYRELTQGKSPYAPITAKLVVKDLGKSTEGFAASYAGTFEVVEIISVRELLPKNCANE